ncbi:transcriptional repressor general negative regulator of transcription subunit 4 [Scheffersomyces amazonensis]|uniref:transcriptional repressor general negative regulator of transcription subunit 4 n=1 Tax=Scheffersomyces amazonensis TaxID=1078765 RepID=UPI00315C6751
MVPTDDSFISDDEEEYCPLCVEEMDISDKNFKPCPCGYQICQFCYNNIKQNPELNGRCPGCRRLYDDESVEYKSISAEEYKIQQMKREKRDREKKQREKEKKETEMANKKHLAGLRVVQKNLVYVTGLNPPCPPEDLHSVLRSEKYFGQYGKISKIVINKKSPTPSTPHHHQSPGIVVYVTFARKEDALKCINELDGSLCDGRILRAAHGTTKYCSSYLRGHPCPNPNCMFLHEPGEEADSYTRKDLSTQQGIKLSMMGMNANSRVGSSSNISGSHPHMGPFSGDEDVTSQSEEEQDHTETSANPLPATAQWAKAGSNSASNSPSVNNNIPLAHSAAFPTLGEIFRDQKQQQQQSVSQRKESGKHSKSKIGRQIKEIIPDDIDIDDNSTSNFAEETVQILKDLESSNAKLEVNFKKFSHGEGKVLPLFAFVNKESLSNSQIEDKKALTREIVERFMLRPIKNYHLAYANHPIMQQAILQQQQQQQRQLQQQPQPQPQQVQPQQLPQGQETPNLPSTQLQQLQLEYTKKLSESQHQAQGNTNPQQQHVQQQLLLLQLQQQQQQQQLQSVAGAQANAIRANERANTSTPPPPGLFNPSTTKQAPFPQGAGQLQNPIPGSANFETIPVVGNQSSSSQLLTQLMGGKR